MRLLAAALFLALLIPTAAQADVLVYELPLDVTSEGQFSNYHPEGARRQIVAQRFTPFEDALADQVRWWGFYPRVTVPPNPVLFRIRLYEGVSSPGAVVYETVASVDILDTGDTNDGFPVFECTATGLPLIQLTLNEPRWIEIAYDDNGFNWLQSTSFTHFVAVRSLESDPWIVRPADIADQAFQLIASQSIATEKTTVGSVKGSYGVRPNE